VPAAREEGCLAARCGHEQGDGAGPFGDGRVFADQAGRVGGEVGGEGGLCLGGVDVEACLVAADALLR
jgi:hypothetical protein